jgi:lambda family phage portal protein
MQPVDVKKPKPVEAPNPWDHRTQLNSEIATWTPTLTSWDNDIQPGFEINRGRARDLALTNPHVLSAVETQRDAVIGRRFTLVLMPDADYLGVSEDEADEWAGLVEAEWRRYAEGMTFDIDATRKATWTGICHQAQYGLHVDGEALATVEAKDGPYGYQTCIQLIEPERLDERNAQNIHGKDIRHGVERDRHGEPIAYYIRESHPHDARWTKPGQMPKRVERYGEYGRAKVVHVMDEPRPSMTRGVSSGMLSTLAPAKMLDVLGQTELSRNIMSASYAAVIESELNYEQAFKLLGAGGVSAPNNLTAAAVEHIKSVAPYHQKMGMRFNGARALHLLPGEKFNLVQSDMEGVQFEAFEKAFLKKIAAGLGVSYEELSRDYSGVSYAAARMSAETAWRRYLRQRSMFNAKFCMPIVSAWLEEALLRKRVPMLGSKFKVTRRGYSLARYGLCRGEFISWGRPIIDPVKETTGAHMRLALGLTTMRDESAASGDDYALVLRQRAREVKERAKHGVLNANGVDPTLVIGGGKQGNPQEERRARSDGAG